jgi:hypothetical protein
MAETHQWSRYVFSLEVLTGKARCSECRKKMEIGETAWVSRPAHGSKYVAAGKVAKRVCSEDCGMDFDYREMAELVRERVWRGRLARQKSAGKEKAG